MYRQHFGLRERPFKLTPDTSYFYEHPSHKEALDTLVVALRMGEGFIKVTGEVGTGKTLLCRKLLNLLEGKCVTAYIPNPFLQPAGLRHALAEELGIEYQRNIGQHRLLKLIYERLIQLRRERKPAVLLIDEAQTIPDDSLEAVRLLTNLETEKTKLLQVVLFGQPELDKRLNRPQMRQLRQRITFSYLLQPMKRAGISGYVDHRLRVAGYSGTGLFTPRAMGMLAAATKGIPRVANILAHKAMLAAYGKGSARIQPADVRLAIRDTDDVSVPLSPWRVFWSVLAGLTLSTAAGASVLFLFGA